MEIEHRLEELLKVGVLIFFLSLWYSTLRKISIGKERVTSASRIDCNWADVKAGVRQDLEAEILEERYLLDHVLTHLLSLPYVYASLTCLYSQGWPTQIYSVIIVYFVKNNLREKEVIWLTITGKFAVSADNGNLGSFKGSKLNNSTTGPLV